MKIVFELAPAKINFGLRILPKREDGFHQLESIFQVISLCDEITVCAREDSCCNIVCKDFELPEYNTILCAYNAFRKVVNAEVCGINVEVKKRIPSGGGLGGGSSDAAAFVKAYAKLNGITLSRNEKHEIASMVGSDVFFFMESDTGCALVSGRGETVKDIEPRHDLYLLLAFPGVHIATKEAFRLFDVYGESSEGRIDVDFPAFCALENVYRSPIDRWTFKNAFTHLVAARHKEIANALSAMKDAGASYAEMSGSGSTVYGVFFSERDALSAQNILKKSLIDCVFVQSFR